MTGTSGYTIYKCTLLIRIVDYLTSRLAIQYYQVVLICPYLQSIFMSATSGYRMHMQSYPWWELVISGGQDLFLVSEIRAEITTLSENSSSSETGDQMYWFIASIGKVALSSVASQSNGLRVTSYIVWKVIPERRYFESIELNCWNANSGWTMKILKPCSLVLGDGYPP